MGVFSHSLPKMAVLAPPAVARFSKKVPQDAAENARSCNTLPAMRYPLCALCATRYARYALPAMRAMRYPLRAIRWAQCATF